MFYRLLHKIEGPSIGIFQGFAAVASAGNPLAFRRDFLWRSMTRFVVSLHKDHALGSNAILHRAVITAQSFKRQTSHRDLSAIKCASRRSPVRPRSICTSGSADLKQRAPAIGPASCHYHVVDRRRDGLQRMRDNRSGPKPCDDVQARQENERR